MKPSDRYLKIVEWSDEDQCYVGRCPGLMYGGVHGDNELRVYKELCQEVDEWIRIFQEHGDPLPEPTAGKNYSGKFVIRVGRELHKQLAVAALRAGQSLNSYCTHVLQGRTKRRGPTTHRRQRSPSPVAAAPRRRRPHGAR
jgi:predicted HicB family RNase H-like nuclease